MTRFLPVAAMLLTASHAGADGLSAQGFSGLLNTPTAAITPAGSIDLQYNNQVERQFPDSFTVTDTYLFTSGLFPNFEFGGRLSNAGPDGLSHDTNLFTFSDHAVRDLSSSAKLQLLNSEDTGLRLAVGVQDVFGETQDFRSSYVVGDYRWRFLQMSLGFGTDRIDGAFGGLSLDLGPHLSVIAENDSEETNIGLRLTTGQRLGRFRIDALFRASASESSEEQFIGIGLRLPLGAVFNRRPPAAPARVLPIKTVDTTQPSSPAPPEQAPPADLPKVSRPDCLTRLARRLDQHGFERLKLGTLPSGVAVELETRRFPRSYLDGLGLALGLTAQTCEHEAGRVAVILTQNGIGRYWVSADTQALLANFRASQDASPSALALGLRAGFGRPDWKFDWDERRPPQRRTWVEATVEPELRYAVATELGVLDYSTAIETRLAFPLWPGADLTARRHDTVDDTRDFEGAGPLAGSALQDGWQELQLRQVFRLQRRWLAALTYAENLLEGAGGRLIAAETAYVDTAGTNQFYLNYAQLEFDDREPQPGVYTEQYSLVGTYRWHAPHLNFSLDLSYGRFLFEDKGARLVLSRHFGDTELRLFYRGQLDGKRQAAGIQFVLPLTPRKSYTNRWMSLRGNPDWSPSLETTLNLPSGQNFIDGTILQESLPANSLQREFLDRGRLGPDHLVANWAQFRDAWRRYAIPPPGQAP